MKLIIDTETLNEKQDEALAKVMEQHKIKTVPVETIGKEIKIGEVGVDSGQLVVCDPCYIDSEWEKEELKLEETLTFPDGTKEKIVRCSKRWFEMIDKINSGEVKLDTKINAKSNFSYNAVCEKTLGMDSHGQLNYRMGHPGVAVAFSSGIGDGCYPVYAKLVDLEGWGVRIAEVRIDMLLHPLLEATVETKEAKNVCDKTTGRKN